MELKTQQKQAIGLLQEFIANPISQVFILKGYAGTGKTTLIKHFNDYLLSQNIRPQIMAPTGRATKVLRSKLGSPYISTIHRGIYHYGFKIDKTEEEGELKYTFPIKENGNSLIIIDEASMISSQKVKDEIFCFGTNQLMNDLLTYAQLNSGNKIIFVGDGAQLPPVGDNRSVALDKSYFEELNLSVQTFELTEVVRQDKDNAILANSINLRNLLLQKERNHFQMIKKENEVINLNSTDVVKLYSDEFKAQHSSAIICYSNRQANEYNRAIRTLLFPQKENVTEGDRLMVVSNNYSGVHSLYNGDLITVLSVSSKTIAQSAPVWVEQSGKKDKITVTLIFRKIKYKTESGEIGERYIIDSLLNNNNRALTANELKALYINYKIRNPHPQKADIDIFEDPFYNALQVKYGYAFTCHKSQGGEWDTVYVDFSQRQGLNDDSLRWKYTAITRAERCLCCINSFDILPLDKIKISPITKCTKIAKEAFSFAPVKETPFHSADSFDFLKCKYWSVVDHMRETDYSVKAVTSKPWRDIYEINGLLGTYRVDLVYNKSGSFKYELKNAPDELLSFFENENNISYDIHCPSHFESLHNLYNKIVSVCQENGIIITNVLEKQYQLIFYMVTDTHSSLSFNFNKKGFVTYASPASLKGEDDCKLMHILECLK